MNKNQVITQLKTKYPQAALICLPEADPQEILCEVEPTTDHSEYSLALAVIDRSAPHFHLKTTETYKVIKGSLKVYIDNVEHQLQVGESIVIEPNQVHYAIGNATWVECLSQPGWTAADHILQTN